MKVTSFYIYRDPDIGESTFLGRGRIGAAPDEISDMHLSIQEWEKLGRPDRLLVTLDVVEVPDAVP